MQWKKIIIEILDWLESGKDMLTQFPVDRLRNIVMASFVLLLSYKLLTPAHNMIDILTLPTTQYAQERLSRLINMMFNAVGPKSLLLSST